MKREWKFWLFGALIIAVGMLIGQGCSCDSDTGLGMPAKIKVNPKNLIFQAITIGEQRTKRTTISNVGLSPLTISELKVVNESGKAFSLLKTPKLPIVLEVDGKLTLTVVYKPKSAGLAKGYVKIVSDAANADDGDVTKVKLSSTEVMPDIVVDPNPVDFGRVKSGDTGKKTVTVLNRGQAPLTLEDIHFESNKEKEFAFDKLPSFPKILNPGDKLTFDVLYRPRTISAQDYIVFKNTTKSLANFKVAVLGKLAAPDIEVVPKRVQFSALIGGVETKSFAVRNVGGNDLKITRIFFDKGSSPDYSFVKLPSFPLIIKAGKEEKIEVKYDSKDKKDDVAFAIIESNDPDEPSVKVELTARAEGCFLVPVPLNLLFTKASVRQVMITNRGNKDCHYLKATLDIPQASAGEFSFATPPPAAQTIPPNKGFKISIRFKPKDAKNDNAKLIIHTDDKKNPKLTIGLVSKLGSSSPCDIKISPTTLNFGFVRTGQSRLNRTVLTNNGYGDCLLKQANINPNPDQVFVIRSSLNPQGVTIPSGGTLSIEIAFTPKNPKAYSGTLSIVTNDPKTPQAKISLIGTSGKLCIEALPDPLDFGSVKINCSTPKQKMEIFNICTRTAKVTKLKFGVNTNKPLQEFFIKRAPMMPVTLSYGRSFTMEFTYAARNIGADVGTIEIYNDVPNQSPIIITLRGKGVTTNIQTDTFTQQKKPSIDILFVIDDSCSMQEDQNNLARNFQSFIQWASQLQVQYHIGVATTDVNKKGCFHATGSKPYVDNNTPNVKSVFANNVKVGIHGNPVEKGLQSSWLALSPTALQGCNRGFYRKDASLSVVYVSDEVDQSKQPVSFYVNFLRSLKGIRNPDKIRASAIGPYSANSSKCRQGQCRYLAVAKMLRGIYEPITSTQWGRTLSQLGAITFGYRSQFFLSRPADPSSIKVTVQGRSVPQSSSNGWTYDGMSNSVNFSKSTIPGAGEVIKITYKALCLPP